MKHTVAGLMLFLVNIVIASIVMTLVWVGSSYSPTLALSSGLLTQTIVWLLILDSIFFVAVIVFGALGEESQAWKQ